MITRKARSHLANGAKNAVVFDREDVALFEIDVIKGYARENECIGNHPEDGEGIVMGLTCYSPKAQQFVPMANLENEMHRIRDQANEQGWKDWKSPRRGSRRRRRRY